MRTRPCLVFGFVLLVGSNLSAQQITGRVTDQQTGQPLAAVQIFISGSGIGALTQQNGRYLLLNVPAGTHTLTAERIGYRSSTAQVTVAAGATVVQDFTLGEEALGLDEIIVTGTPGGTQRRAIGNAVLAVDASEVVQTVAVNSIQDMMSGRSPGVQFSRVSGNVGTGAAMDIRGAGSFLVGGNPLIYIDGIRVNNSTETGPRLGDQKDVNPLDDLNPQDIESIEIIKGPAAGTLYGTEASAGVIQIITKRGAEGAPNFDVSLTQGFSFIRDPAGRLGPKWTCTNHYGPPCREGAGLAQYNAYDEGNRLLAQGAFPWPEPEIFSYGRINSFNGSVRGGTQNSRYFFSTNYDNESGSTWYNWDKTFRLRANGSVVFSDNFSLDVSTGYVEGKTSFQSQAATDGGEWEDLFWGTGYCVPRINGKITGRKVGPGQVEAGDCPRLLGFQEHLPSDVAKIEVTREYNRFTGSATLNFTSGEWLASRAIVGVDKAWDENVAYWPLETELEPVYTKGGGGTAVGELTLERPITTNYSFDASATVNKNVMGAFTTATSVGMQYYIKRLNSFTNRGLGFASPLSRTINQTTATRVQIGYEFVENKSLGVFVQEVVGWNDRIFVTGAIRADDNSAFGSEFELETYPKLSATWVVSEESFWNVDLVNSLRLRGAWGKAGRQPDTFAGTTQYNVISGPDGNPMIRPLQPGNTKVGPEVSTELELGIDLALLDDRVSTEFTWFRQQNADALLAVPLPPSFGIPGNSQQNLGRLDNWGWEATARVGVYESREISLSVDFTGSHVDNEIKDLGGFTGNNTVQVGYPYPNYVWNKTVLSAKYDPAGPFQDQYGRKISAMCDAGVRLKDAPGYGYREGGAAVPCQQAPPTILHGRAFDTYQWSVSPRVNLMNTLLLSVLVDGAYGRMRHSNQGCGICYLNNYQQRTDDDPLSVAEFYYIGGQNMGQFDADFWKLREVGARWTLPESVTNRIGADAASLSLAARELWTIWQSQKRVPKNGAGPGLWIEDPEVGRVSAGASGWRVVPPSTAFNATLRVTF